MAKVELYWDAVSSYTYLAFTQLVKLAERTGAEVELKPFLLGGVFKATQNVAPANNPTKARYILNDLKHWASYYNVPMKMPWAELPFPLNSLLVMRAAVAAQTLGAGDAFAHAAMNAFWRDGRDISQPEIVAAVAEEMGLDGDSLVALANGQAAKDGLRKNSDEAVERGAFGAPSFFVGEALYWGNDRLPLVEAHLKRLT